MSTKCSLTCGDKFHLYTDCLDRDAYVYFELDDVEFEANQARVTIRIPVPIWEHVRTYSPAKYDLLSLTDMEFRLLAGKRAAEWKRLIRNTASKPLLRTVVQHRGSTSIREMLRRLRKQRAEQRKLRAAVEQIAKTADAYSKPQLHPKRRRRVLIPEYRRMQAQAPKENEIQQALDEVRGDR